MPWTLWRMDEVVPSAEVLRLIDAAMPLEPVDPSYSGEVAERWRYRDGSGEVGVIASVTQAFCRDCSRARLSTDGAPPFLFYMVGNIAWAYFASCLDHIARTFVANLHVLGKVYFHRLVIPVSSVKRYQ